MSIQLLDISATKAGKRGNSKLCTANRLKRLKEGQNISFENDRLLPLNNPFGKNSVVRLWNEEVAYQQYMKSIGKFKQQRDSLGKFKSFKEFGND